MYNPIPLGTSSWSGFKCKKPIYVNLQTALQSEKRTLIFQKSRCSNSNFEEAVGEALVSSRKDGSPPFELAW
jgi:hypothetical protein